MTKRKTNKGFVEYAIQEIKDRFSIDLPEFGSLAGQSVAQLYFEYFGYDIETRIKDIDLFVFLNKDAEKNIDFLKEHMGDLNQIGEKGYVIRKSKEIQKIKSSKNLKDIASMSEESCEINKPISIMQKSIKSLQVINSTMSEKNELLNITFYRQNFDNKVKNFTKDLISLFDMNAVKIGIDLKSKKLFLDDGFKEFLKTRYVELDLVNFKPSSIIRYFDKYGYYKNCIFNIEQELKKIYLKLFYQKEYKFDQKKFLANRLEKLNKKSLRAINDYLRFKKNSIQPLDSNQYFVDKKDVMSHIDELIKESIETNKIRVGINYFLLLELNYQEFLKIKKLFSLPSGKAGKNNFLFVSPSDYRATNLFFRLEKEIVNIDSEELFINFIEMLKYPENINKYFYDAFERKRDIIDRGLRYINKQGVRKNIFSVLKFERIETLSFGLRNKMYLRDFKKTLSLYDGEAEDSFVHQYWHDNFVAQNINLSPKNINKINSYDFKSNRDRNTFLLAVTEAAEKYRDKSLINVKKDSLKTIFRHDFIGKMMFNYPIFEKEKKFKNIKEYFESFAERIRFFENNDYLYFIGLFETQRIPFSLFFEDVGYLKEFLEKLSFFVESDYIIEDFKIYEKDGIVLKQLVNRMDLIIEGQEMRHCIGGNNFNRCQLHFSLLNKDKKERTTFSLYLVTSRGEFFIREIKNKFNTMTSNDNEKIIQDIITVINKKYAKELIEKCKEKEPDFYKKIKNRENIIYE